MALTETLNRLVSNPLHVAIEGTPLSDDVAPLFRGGHVDDELGASSMFVLVFSDPERTVLSATKAGVGKKVRLSAFDPNNPAILTPILSGEITALESEFGPDGAETIIRGFDLVHRLHRGRKSCTYAQMTYSQVASKVAKDAGLTVGRIDPTAPMHDHVGRNLCTDWQFLTGLADEVGFEVTVTDGKLNFQRPLSASTGPAIGTFDSSGALALVPGGDLISFRATITSAEQVSSVEVRGWDAKAKKVLVGTAPAASTSASNGTTAAKLASAFGGRVHVSGDTPFDKQGEVDSAAKSIADEIAGAAAEFEGIAFGNPQLRAGTAVSLGLAGAPFDGKYTLTTVRHVWDAEGGYRTTFTASGRQARSLYNLTGHDASRRASGPRIPGVMNGIVTNNNDPDKVGRVKVKLSTLAENYETDWVRVAHIGAGQQRGLCFTPEVNDEVLVAFDHGDLRQPYVLGGLYNHQDKPLATAYAVNASDGKVEGRGIVTRVGHRILFNDKEGAGNGIEIKTGKDQLQIVMDEQKKTITVTSKGDVIVETQGNVTVKATKNFEVDAQQISLKAKQGVSVDAGGGAFNAKGSTATVEGQGQAELKGATTNVKGSAMVVVQGALVKIN